VLALHEQGDEASALTRLAEDLPLFSAGAKPAPPRGGKAPSAAEEMLRETRPDELSPKEALDLLYRLKSLVEKK
jgi:DNA mismatch repair protein MutS